MTLNDSLLVAVLLVVLGAGLSIVISTLLTGMSPMPSSAACRGALRHHIDDTALPPGPIIDIGSGWGHLLISLGRECPDRQVVGFEVSALPYWFSRLWVALAGLHNVEVRQADFFAAWGSMDTAGAAWVTYLHRPAMERLADGIRAGNPAPRWLFSNNFSLPGFTPDAVWQQGDFYRSLLYRYLLS